MYISKGTWPVSGEEGMAEKLFYISVLLSIPKEAYLICKYSLLCRRNYIQHCWR